MLVSVDLLVHWKDKNWVSFEEDESKIWVKLSTFHIYGKFRQYIMEAPGLYLTFMNFGSKKELNKRVVAE
jgi:hypothetical protein